ncbi:hypothetical protein SFMTTN_2547 [Sulfuriferula multivorans]|uniref:Uncharacterized protein n=1 Tax=Sulfuriferula multivorans TaxID=1559896 RepID=A0A401JGJ7_9PROT|nr:hypothetical protein SFMTTN_2547 [Sulfuriferula multivorans]
MIDPSWLAGWLKENTSLFIIDLECRRGSLEESITHKHQYQGSNAGSRLANA